MQQRLRKPPTFRPRWRERCLIQYPSPPRAYTRRGGEDAAHDGFQLSGQADYENMGEFSVEPLLEQGFPKAPLGKAASLLFLPVSRSVLLPGLRSSGSVRFGQPWLSGARDPGQS
jgi:hypothetical protein